MIENYAYYNEFDPKAAAWLRKLILNGNIAPGIVDERSITEVSADDLRGFNQCHFFAGIGGWSHSLRLEGVSDDYPVWTASLPCQPFSVAGLQKGKADERHLLPHFLELVRQCKPDRIFGEQVEGAIRHGWLDDLQTNMEAEGYAVGHCVLGAHSVGSFHQRQRLYWVAHPSSKRPQEQPRERNELQGFAETGVAGRMGNTEHNGQHASEEQGSNGASILGSEKRQDSTGESEGAGASRNVSSIIGLGDTKSNKEHAEPERGLHAESGDECDSSEWSNPDWLYCRDNKYRAIKPGIKPLVDGLPKGMGYSSDPSQPIDANATQEARVMRLKGYGNAIVPQVAAEFISAFMESTS